jgi:hypothetical protein
MTLAPLIEETCELTAPQSDDIVWKEPFKLAEAMRFESEILLQTTASRVKTGPCFLFVTEFPDTTNNVLNLIVLFKIQNKNVRRIDLY